MGVYIIVYDPALTPQIHSFQDFYAATCIDNFKHKRDQRPVCKERKDIALRAIGGESRNITNTLWSLQKPVEHTCIVCRGFSCSNTSCLCCRPNWSRQSMGCVGASANFKQFQAMQRSGRRLRTYVGAHERNQSTGPAHQRRRLCVG